MSINKSLYLIPVISLALVGTTVFAKSSPEGKPFQDLWTEISGIWSAIDKIETTPGNAGKDGISCWDLNGNGVVDRAAEDVNSDGVVDAEDCRGPKGEVGASGSDGLDGVDGVPGPAGLSLKVYDGAGQYLGYLSSFTVRSRMDAAGCVNYLVPSVMPASVLLYRIETVSLPFREPLSFPLRIVAEGV
jgi:hypothetical protein